MNDDDPYLRLRERAYEEGRHARRTGRMRVDSPWHRERTPTVGGMQGRAAFELGWTTEDRNIRNQETRYVRVG